MLPAASFQARRTIRSTAVAWALSSGLGSLDSAMPVASASRARASSPARGSVLEAFILARGQHLETFGRDQHGVLPLCRE